jgi:hypothetical protein
MLLACCFPFDQCAQIKYYLDKATAIRAGKMYQVSACFHRHNTPEILLLLSTMSTDTSITFITNTGAGSGVRISVTGTTLIMHDTSSL